MLSLSLQGTLIVWRQAWSCVTLVQLYMLVPIRRTSQMKFQSWWIPGNATFSFRNHQHASLTRLHFFFSTLIKIIYSLELAHEKWWEQVWKLYLCKVTILSMNLFPNSTGIDWGSPQRFGHLKSNLFQWRRNSRHKNFSKDNPKVISADIPVESRPQRVYWYIVKSERFS